MTALFALAFARRGEAQVCEPGVLKPYFLLIVDTSGSMSATTGSSSCRNSCNFRCNRINDAACVVQHIADGVGDAVFGLQTFPMNCRNTVYGNGSHYSSVATGPFDPNPSCGTTSCSTRGCIDGGTVWVPMLQSRQAQLRRWGDGVFGSCTTDPLSSVATDPELSDLPGGTGAATSYESDATSLSHTPLAGTLRAAYEYLTGPQGPMRNFEGTGRPDPSLSCRPYGIILLTDGDENCASEAAAEANARDIGCLRGSVGRLPGIDRNGNGLIENPNAAGQFETNTDLNGDSDCYDAGEQRVAKVNTYVIGFGQTACYYALENIARGGGTASGQRSGGGAVCSAFYATNETTISQAINQIVSDAVPHERCNYLDDDCDGLVDEDFRGACGALGPTCSNPPSSCTFGACTAGTGACQGSGTYRCNAAGDGVECGAVPRTPSPENTDALCANLLDDDCDGLRDCADPDCVGTLPCRSCIPTGSEVCNGLDDDCNGAPDDRIPPRTCYTGPSGTQGVGICLPGTQTCVGGTFGACTGQVTPGTEVCDGLDNDCDGTVDNHIAPVPCGTDTGTCVRGLLDCRGVCVGEVAPAPEQCDGLDHDCNGVPNDIPGASCDAGGCTTGGHRACNMGATTCVPDALRPSTFVCRAAVTGGCDLEERCTGTLPNCPADATQPSGTTCRPAAGACDLPERCNGSNACPAVDVLVPLGALCRDSTGPCDLAETCTGASAACPADTTYAPSTTVCNRATGPCAIDSLCTGSSNTCPALRFSASTVSCRPAVPGGCDLEEFCTGSAAECPSDALRPAGTVCRAAIPASPPAETCDVAEVCDGSSACPADGFRTAGAACRASTTPSDLSCDPPEVCTGGQPTCPSDVVRRTPVDELCDGFDNNCNGMTDEGIPDAPCGVPGTCSAGVRRCTGGHFVCEGSRTTMDEICDNVDNNCNGAVDEGLVRRCYTGTPPGTEGVGLCRGGSQTCAVGVWGACVGEITPAPEQCDGRDNNCNGPVDDDIRDPEHTGRACPRDMTVPDRAPCHPGVEVCRSAMWQCEGAVLPQPEVCNCADDDCDGMIDNLPGRDGGVGGTDSVCVQVRPGVCELRRPCAENHCTLSLMTCAIHTLSGSTTTVNVCEADTCTRCPSGQHCENGDCVPNCPRRTPCPGGQACNPADGQCVANGCIALQNCTAGQVCRANRCVDDPCAGVSCGDGQACYEGRCAASCATVVCQSGSTCRQGACVATGCAMPCSAGRVCNAASGMCEPDRCSNLNCPASQRCDPLTGTCQDDPCTVVRCPSGQTCTAGQCTFGTTPPPPVTGPARDRGVATGGGAFSCAVGPPRPGAPPWPWLLMAVACLGIARRRRAQ